jgi:hypothetical protein
MPMKLGGFLDQFVEDHSPASTTSFDFQRVHDLLLGQLA